MMTEIDRKVGLGEKSEDSEFVVVGEDMVPGEDDFELRELRELGDRCSELNAKLRSKPISAQTVTTQDFIELWSMYHDLLQRMPVAMDTMGRSDEYRAVLKGQYKAYLRDFNSLKEDITEVYVLSNRDNAIVLPAFDVEDEILSDFVAEIKEYEEKHAEILKEPSANEKPLRKFFQGLFKIIRRCLNYILKLFYTGEINENMIFSLTPLVRMRWSAMLLMDSSTNKEEYLLLFLIETKAKDLTTILSKEVLSLKNKISKGDDYTIEKIDIQNKFSQYIKNIADTLTTKEIATLNQMLLSKSLAVMDSEKQDAFFSKLKQAIPGKDGHQSFGSQLSKQTACILNIVMNMIESISVIESLLELVPMNAFEFGLYANFVKKYGIRVFTLECFSKLDRFNDQRSKGMLRC